MSKAWYPVINYEGCSSLCPTGAIEYVGNAANSCCDSGCYNC